MSDSNITVDNGAGTDYVPATDRVAGADYQLVKLVNSAEDSVARTGVAGDPLIVGDGGSTLSIDDGAGSITVDGTVAVSGTVTVATHDVGSITTAIVPGTAATNLGKAEDAVHTTGDVGVMALAVRTDTAAARATTDGDYAPLEVDSTGRLHVNVGNTVAVSGTVTVTGVATEATLASLLTSSQLIDDSITTTGSAVTAKGILATGTDGTNARGLKTDSSGELQIDVLTLPALVAGTANIGDVDVLTLPALPAGTNNIGDVDVLTVIPGTSATSLGKAEDAVAASGDTGVLALGVRQDTAGSTFIAGTEGDYSALTLDAVGRLHTVVGGSPTIGPVNPGSGALNLGKIEDGAHTTGDMGIMALAVRRDAAAVGSGTDGDYSTLNVDANGALYVTGGGGGTQYTVDDAAPASPVGSAPLAERDDALATLTEVDGDWTNLRTNNRGAQWVVHDGAITATVASTSITTVVPGTTATTLGKAEDAAHASSDVGVMALAVRRDAAAVGSGTDGDYSTLNVDANGALYVTGAGGGTQYNIDSVASATATGTVALVVRKDAGASLANADGDISGLQVDASGSLRVTGGGGGTEYTEDVASPGDPVGGATMLVRDDATGSIVTTDGDWIAARANVNGAQWVAMDGTVGLAAGTNNIGDVDVLSLPALPAGSNNIGDVDIASSVTLTVNAHAVTNAGTFATQVDGAALTALQLIDDSITTTGSAVTAKGILATGTDGTNARGIKTDAAGELQVDVLTMPTVTVSTHDVGSITTAIVPGVAATNLGKREDDAHTSLDTGVFALAVRHDTATTGLGADGDYAALSVGSDGRLQVNVGNTVTVAAHDVGSITTAVVPGTAATNLGKAEDAVHTTGDVGVMMLGVRADTQAATAANGDYQPAIFDASGGLWTAGTLVDDAAFTPATSRVNVVGLFADEASTDSVDEGDIGVARMTLDRKQIMTQYAHTTGGYAMATDIDLDETELEVKASAGQLYGWYIYNDGAAEVYVKLYNATAASVAVGTTVPVLTFGIPAGGAANLDLSSGIIFDTAICAAATTVCTTADTTAPAANQVVANFFYK